MAPLASEDGMTNAFADFQNQALMHEEAAHQKRNWVRLSYDCNNHCTFCLDSNAHDGTMRATMDIKVQILSGRKRGAERLILSGGEPTMHPNFLDFVRLGKRAGYPRIQTVTNGRMFAYPEFLRRAAENGLDEITFSLHGHTAKIHDALVGTPGAFDEETKGLKAALASGAFIVNVDIVINKQNVRHLAEMLETFIGWGVREFDLLHIIPFGNAWTDAREHLFYDLEDNLEHLKRAFAYARRPDVHIWLNRFPPPYAEGFEDLIQDPYKLNDEVRGRREEFDRYLALGKKLDCREPERCHRCYLQSLCDGLDDVLATRALPEVDVLRFEHEVPPAVVKLSSARVARVVAKDVAAAKAMAEAVSPREIELELDDYADLDAGSGWGERSIVACYVASPSVAEELLSRGSFEVRVALTRQTGAWLEALDAPPPRLVLVQPKYARSTAHRELDIDLAAFFQRYPHRPPLEGIPECLSGVAPRRERRVLDVAMLGADGRVDMGRFTPRFIEDRFMTKSLRCSSCASASACAGVSVSWVRAHGFSSLEPIKAAAPAETAAE